MVRKIPSITVKFLKPTASSLCLTISIKSGIWGRPTGKHHTQMKLLEKMKIDKVVAIFTCSCSFCMSAAMYTSFLVEREAGIPPSLPPSSNEARLEVEEAELGRGLAGSLVASGQESWWEPVKAAVSIVKSGWMSTKKRQYIRPNHVQATMFEVNI